METQRRMTAHDLTRALRQRGMHQYQFAKIVGIPGSSLSATLAGVTPLTPSRKAAIERGIAELRLTEEVPPTENMPIFSVSVESTSE